MKLSERIKRAACINGCTPALAAVFLLWGEDTAALEAQRDEHLAVLQRFVDWWDSPELEPPVGTSIAAARAAIAKAKGEE